MTEYPKPSLTADVAVIARGAGDDRVLFIERARPPFQGAFALPGGFCEPGETVEQSARRELCEETGLDAIEVEQVRCFSTPGRDPRGWVVSILHVAIVAPEAMARARAGDDAARATWLRVRRSGGRAEAIDDGGQPVALAFDHAEMLASALDHAARRA